MKQNQLDSSFVGGALVSQMRNLIQSPAQKCKHSTIYTHTWYVQTPELLKEFICRITGPGFAYLIKKPVTDLIIWEGKIKVALVFFTFIKFKRI